MEGISHEYRDIPHFPSFRQAGALGVPMKFGGNPKLVLELS